MLGITKLITDKHYGVIVNTVDPVNIESIYPGLKGKVGEIKEFEGPISGVVLVCVEDRRFLLGKTQVKELG